MALRNWVRVSRRSIPGAGANAGGFVTMIPGSEAPPQPVPTALAPPEPLDPTVPPELDVPVAPPLPGAPVEPPLPDDELVRPPDACPPDEAPPLAEAPPSPMRPVQAAIQTRAHAIARSLPRIW